MDLVPICILYSVGGTIGYNSYTNTDNNDIYCNNMLSKETNRDVMVFRLILIGLKIHDAY